MANMNGMKFRMMMQGAKENLELLNELEAKITELNQLIMKINSNPVRISFAQCHPDEDCRQEDY